MSAPVIPNYVRGKGEEFIHCVTEIYESEYRNLRSIFLSEDFIPPAITYDTLANGRTGAYLPDEDVITLDTNRVVYVNNSVRCIGVVRHEFAHRLLDLKSREIGNGRWPIISTGDRRRFSLDDYGVQLISEGLARYFGEHLKVENVSESWPRTREELYCSNPYLLGDYLVTKIVKDFGVEAIPFMIRDPPRGAEVFNPREWQTRTIERIRRGKIRNRIF
jgi:hypothetical protein